MYVYSMGRKQTVNQTDWVVITKWFTRNIYCLHLQQSYTISTLENLKKWKSRSLKQWGSKTTKTLWSTVVPKLTTLSNCFFLSWAWLQNTLVAQLMIFQYISHSTQYCSKCCLLCKSHAGVFCNFSQSCSNNSASNSASQSWFLKTTILWWCSTCRHFEKATLAWSANWNWKLETLLFEELKGN